MKKVAKKYTNKGITLITLVVTIIVLIILAGVSINLMLGEKGIITIAKQAKENTELAKIEEETKLNELYIQIETEGINSGDTSYNAIAKLVEFKREIASAISDMGITTAEDADVSTMSSNIRSISRASTAEEVSYDNTNSGLTATNVQGAVDEVNNNIETLSADKISYNNTNSGLTATNVQGAVDELNSSLSDVLSLITIPYRGVMGMETGLESKDFNDYLTNGIYGNSGTNSGFTNAPNSADNGILLVIGMHQFWFSNYRKLPLTHRRYNGSTWTNWENIGS